MADYELQAFSVLFQKLAARLGLDSEHPSSEVRMRAALSALIEEDAEAAELARTLLALRGPVEGDGPPPGRPISLGDNEDLLDAEALYAVVEACRSLAGRDRARGAGRLLREAIWTLWEQPRLPPTLLDGRCPTSYPWSPSARGTVATQAKRPQGLVIGHLYPLERLAGDLMDECNGSALDTVALLQGRIISAILTRQEDRLVRSPTGMPWEAFEADPWCRYRVVLPVGEFAPIDRDG